MSLVPIQALDIFVTAALLLAVACARPPLYDMGGPECVTPTAPCQCSEGFVWSPVANAAWYEIDRKDPDGTRHYVGTSTTHIAYIDEDGTSFPRDPQEVWFFQRDTPAPVEGTRYEYRVRACFFGAPCGAWVERNDGKPIIYWGAPTWCFDQGIRVTCR